MTCQGCHISEGAGRIIFFLISFDSLGSLSMETEVKYHGNQNREFFQSRLFVDIVKRLKIAIMKLIKNCHLAKLFRAVPAQAMARKTKRNWGSRERRNLGRRERRNG